MKPYKVVLVLLVAAAIAFLGLLRGGGDLAPAAAGHPLDGHFDALMPRYPGVSEFPLGDAVQVGDGEIRMSYFATSDAPLRVARYYRTLWEQQGLAVHGEVTPEGGVVGTYDPRVGAARSVTMYVESGRTWVFPATMPRPLEALRSGDIGEREGLPAFPGSTRGLTLRTDDSGRSSLVASYANSGGMEENARFYLREMSARGWTEVESPEFSELEGHRALEFQRQGARCTVNLTPVQGTDEVVVCVILAQE